MILGIDATSTRVGGGVTHLVEFLREARPVECGITKIVVWSCSSTLNQIDERPWLEKRYRKVFDRSLPLRLAWQIFSLSKAARRCRCDGLLIWGGSSTGRFRPFVAMQSNLLPFEMRELRRFGISLMTVKLLLLRMIQKRTFKMADGVIYFTHHARNVVNRLTGKINAAEAVIPHGSDSRFFREPRQQFPLNLYSTERPFKVLYVSQLDMYKHQWNVAEAVISLSERGYPLTLELVGGSYPNALKRLERVLRKRDPSNRIVRYSGRLRHGDIHSKYLDADLAICASSCETFGQVLTEAMAAGLPIACSARSGLPEILGDGGVYFDCEDPDDIARAITELLQSPDLRERIAAAAFGRASKLSWRKCADSTLMFVASTFTDAGRD